MVTFSFFSADRFPLLNKVILQSRISWSIRLRWLAILGFGAASLLANEYFSLPLNIGAILITLGALALLNTVWFIFSRWWKETTFDNEFFFLSLHIVLDLIVLTLLLHYSGGVENPIYIFYIFHVVISSIIFPDKIPWLMATFVVLLFIFLVIAEYFLIIHHYCIFKSNLHSQPLFVGLSVFTFTVTTYVTTYICSTFMTFFREIKKEVDQKNSQLEELTKEKEQFFRFTSHELKTPIVAVKSAIDSFINVQQKKIDEKDLHLLRRASFRAGQMLNIINELLELSRSGKTEARKNINPIDVASEVNRIKDISLPSAKVKEIDLALKFKGKNFLVKADEKDFEKVILNLVSNAINYTPEKGKVSISVREEKESVVISVVDTGIGIPEKDLPNIFSEFFRSENAKKFIHYGTGLGLSLVKKIADKNNWSLEVSSKVNSGSNFTVTIPKISRPAENQTGGKK